MKTVEWGFFREKERPGAGRELRDAFPEELK